jgi:hypothetical protein
MVCVFADGVMRRMTFATQEGKPLNTGRGLRLCVGAYRLRVAAILNSTPQRAIVPAIVEAWVERDGRVIARVDASKANEHTAEHRAGRRKYKTVWLPAVIPHQEESLK